MVRAYLSRIWGLGRKDGVKAGSAWDWLCLFWRVGNRSITGDASVTLVHGVMTSRSSVLPSISGVGESRTAP